VNGSEMSRIFGAEMRIQTWKWSLTADAIIGSHAGSQDFIFHEDGAQLE